MKRALALGILAALAAGGDERPARLWIMLGESMFVGVNRNDAVASIRIWIDQFGRNKGFRVDAKVDVFRSAVEIERRLKSRTVDAMVLSAVEFLELGESSPVELMAVPTERGKVGASYLLLVRDRASLPDLASLRGCKLAVASRSRPGIGLIWLETILAERKAAPARRHFDSVTEVDRVSSCALPVFFGRLDACVVDERSWEMLVELNPQMAKLKPIARSEPLVERVFAVPVEPHPYKANMIDALLHLHQDPVGSQLTMLFKMGQFVRAEKQHLEPARVLLERYRRLNLAEEAR